jgi:deoxyribonuclease-4
MPVSLYNWNITGGSHIGYSGNLTDTLKTATNLGMNSCQFFLGNPQSATRSKVTENDISRSVVHAHRFSLKCFSHAPYIYNLCGSKSCLCWSGSKEQDLKTKNIMKSLEYEMDVLGSIGGAVVIHPGSCADRKLGLETIVKTLDKLNFKDHSKLLLENCAGQGDTLAQNFQELSSLLNTKNRDNIGICLDTAHIWGVGDYDISTITGIEKMFTEFDKHIGLEKLELLHLNDSMVNIKSRKDRHSCISQGEIWSKDLSSLRFLLSKLEKEQIPFVLETVVEDYNVVYDIYRK